LLLRPYRAGSWTQKGMRQGIFAGQTNNPSQTLPHHPHHIEGNRHTKQGTNGGNQAKMLTDRHAYIPD
jgi:hypothetical protein